MERDKFIVIIPARYQSTRLPGKPLRLIGGIPMIERVYRRVSEVISDVWVATDDERIRQTVEAFGGKAVMTSADHRSGTDRIREAYERIGSKKEVVINVQGDEPFVVAEQVETLCRLFDDERCEIGTLVKAFTKEDGLDALLNPNSPKVTIGVDSRAIYFSRSVIPYLRGVDQSEWLERHTFYKHIGMYGYRWSVLREVTELEQSVNEKAESLEQLRWIDNGYSIKVGVTDYQTIGIDTEEDLVRAEEYLMGK